MKKINSNINIIANNVVKSSKDIKDPKSIDKVLLKKYNTLEILSGIKITNCVDENAESWYKLSFINLPDECLEFEKNLNLSQLTPKMVESYKSIFEVNLTLF